MANIQCLIFSTLNSSIRYSCVKAVEDELGDNNGAHLYFVIDSTGGDPLSAVRIIRLLQERFQKISVIVPNIALSAATLMSLGGDEIYMYGKSALGPLDLQIEHPNDGSTVSVLDLKMVIFSLGNIVEVVQERNFSLLRQFGLSKTEAAKIATKNANCFVEPVMKQIDPFHLQKSFREIDLAYSYGMQLLLERMMKGKIAQAHHTLKTLTNNFSSHGYGISAKEAKEQLKLNIKDLNSLPEWKKIRPIYDKLNLSENPYDILYMEIP